MAKEVVVGSMSQSYHADGADDTASQQAGEGTLGQKLRASFDQIVIRSWQGRSHRLPAVHARLHALPRDGRGNATAIRHEIAARSVPLSLAVAYVIAVIAFQSLRLIW